MAEAGPRCWIAVASADHVARGVEDGFAMCSHGKHDAVKRLRPGDWVVYYSPRTGMGQGSELRAFTAIGRVREGEPYQWEMAPGMTGWRRDVDFLPARHAPVRPLLDELSFVPDKTHWGMVFRRGLFPVPRTDFVRIANAMGVPAERL